MAKDLKIQISKLFILKENVFRMGGQVHIQIKATVLPESQSHVVYYPQKPTTTNNKA